MAETTTGYTATEAVNALSGVSKKRFYEMMNEGGISFTTEEWGKGTRRIVEGSELARVFGDKFRPRETSNTVSGNDLKRTRKPPETDETISETINLQVEVQVLRKEVAMKNELIYSLKEEKNDWKKQAQTLLLQPPAKNADFKPVQGKDAAAAVGEEKNKKDYSAAKFSAIATILLAILAGGYFWPEIEARLAPLKLAQFVPDQFKKEALVNPMQVHDKKSHRVRSGHRLDFTPAPHNYSVFDDE